MQIKNKNNQKQKQNKQKKQQNNAKNKTKQNKTKQKQKQQQKKKETLNKYFVSESICFPIVPMRRLSLIFGLRRYRTNTNKHIYKKTEP